MNLVEVLEHVRDVLAADATLAAWCETQFLNSPTIYLGLEEDPVFPRTEYPVIGITGANGAVPDAFPGRNFAVGIRSYVYDAGFDVLGKKKTYVGMVKSAGLVGELIDAVKRARFAKITHQSESAGADKYPFFDVRVTLEIEQVRIKRR